MTVSKNIFLTVIALAIILAISACVHFYRLNYPGAPVFDEAHFATYVGDYANREAFFDIHPALGKLLYAGMLLITDKHPPATQFVVETFNHATNKIDDYALGVPYGDFPYLDLRVLSALFGILLPLVFYWFLRSIGIKNLGALLGDFFAALDNALIIQTRLILLDGFLWVFALVALALYFKKTIPPPAGAPSAGRASSPKSSQIYFAGFFFGLALGVKLSAIVFAGPVLIDFCISYFKKGAPPETRASAKQKLIRFAIAAFVTLAVIMTVHPLLFSQNSQITALNTTLGYSIKPLDATAPLLQKTKTYLKLLLVENLAAVPDYLFGQPNAVQSPWYLWPIKKMPFEYFQGSLSGNAFSTSIIFDGNPVVWYASTLAVLLSIIFAWRFFRSSAIDEKNRRSFFILLSSYIFTLLPFVTIVHRSTFLYHYLPSLLFAIGLLAWFISRALKLDNFDTLTKKQGLALILICMTVITGFLIVAPGTYGF